MQKKDFKIIVIEGVDSSGKATQSNLLCQRLLDDGIYLKLIPFHSVIKLWVGQSGGKKISLRDSQHIGFVWSFQAISSLFLSMELYPHN